MSEVPLHRELHPDGVHRWTVTGRAAVHAVLSDPRFSSRTELMSLPDSPPQGLPPAEPGDFVTIDPPEHTRYRRLLTGQFTVRRMRQLTERIEQITEDHLVGMEKHGPPTDLVESFAAPIPAQVICELLGVPYEDRDRFQQHAITVVSFAGGGEDFEHALYELQEYMGALVASKRARPTDDLLSGLTADGLTDEELANIGVGLLGAGLDTTANVIALGVLDVLTGPGVAELEKPDVVEDLLRRLNIVPTLVRVALSDVELEGELIAAGETVLVSLEGANRDPAGLGVGGHLAFGHGIHQCLGQQLARVELGVALPALARRFPNLRLAVAPEEIRVRTGGLARGVDLLPVRWD
ncbi:cytochrome P450 [Crossiella equi]|uniref:Cytochrome P450 n=1 Tax=Crossiella equi TaxID=130796 RepID=A0ABS5AJK9_9PSEU|nr:cytochrome P450 [Crossiella equi]MBP2476394.1 cytochrome P450 [Crossiella equi]